jgi:hypothetical protein
VSKELRSSPVGRPPTLKTEPTKGGVNRKKATIVFPPKVWARLRRYAKDEGRQISWIVVTAVQAYLDETGK